VTGDVDGDGFGDLVTVTYDGGWLLRSDGEGAFAAPTSLPHARYPSVTGDVDGDGRLDVVTMDGEPPTLRVTVNLATGEAPSSLLDSPVVGDLLATTTPFAADMDGDGLDDVGLATLGAGRLLVVVALSREDGTLATSRRWFDGSAPDDTGSNNQLAVGDLTGDGRADLVHVREPDQTPPELRLLASTGTAFVQEGEPQRVPDEARFATWRAGDFDGDGTDELSMSDIGPRVTMLSWDGGRFTEQVWVDDDLDEFYPRQTSVADVDGDGDDDLVVSITGQGLRVIDSTRRSFRVLPGGGRVVAPRRSSEGALGPMVYRD
jgi:hypothetical protein